MAVTLAPVAPPTRAAKSPQPQPIPRTSCGGQAAIAARAASRASFAQKGRRAANSLSDAKSARTPLGSLTRTAQTVATAASRQGRLPLPNRCARPRLGGVERSETRYAQSGDVAIAYRIFGEGPVDLVHTPGAISNVELLWEQPLFARWCDRIGSFTRLIVFDKRGTGLSDRVKRIATLEERSDDIRAVMDAAGSERAVIMGVSEGGPMAVVFAATHPDRTLGLVLYGSHARMTWAPEYPWRPTLEEYRRSIAEEERSPTPVTEESARAALRVLMPTVADGDELARWWAMFTRVSISPGAALDLERMNMENQRQRRTADDPRADGGDPASGRPGREGWRGPLSGRADSWSPLRRASGRRPHPRRRRLRIGDPRDRALRHGSA